MSNDKMNLDSVGPNLIDKMESAKPDIELITRINAGQRVGTPNVPTPQQKKPDFTPPTFKSRDN